MNMRWNVYPNAKQPVEYISFNKYGEIINVKTIGWISTPSLALLKDDMKENIALVGRGLKYE